MPGERGGLVRGRSRGAAGAAAVEDLSSARRVLRDSRAQGAVGSWAGVPDAASRPIDAGRAFHDDDVGHNAVGADGSIRGWQGQLRTRRLEIAEFAKDAKTLLPEIEEADLQLAYTGLRPKLKAPGEAGVADFVIEADPEVSRAIHLIGIESPGLTAAGAIAAHVAELVSRIL